MAYFTVRGMGVLALVVGVALALIGCGDAGKPTQAKAKEEKKSAEKKGDKHDHSGWWCDEHGIPEEECSMCSTKVAEECKKKGDWCKEHDRAKSQCFVCDPKLQEKYAAVYRAKYGKEPPPVKE